MAEETPVVGTIGLKIRVNVGLDVSTATLLQLRYIKPDGAPGNFVGTYELDGTEHKVFYTTTSESDIDQEGRWTFQAYVESGANRFYGTEVKTEKFKAQMAT
jgi:hypothetical protein